jgi:hypothetical protein
MVRKHIYTFATFLIISMGAFAQDYTFEDFVGTWNGTISSTTFSGYNDPITMTIEADGFYTESSGHLMPTIYPNSQECEFDAPTNRFHWWYLDLVYAGQYFYQHFFYEVVYFSNDTLEMHYNFWDDPVPNPNAGTIFLVKENMTPAPTDLGYDLYGNNVVLTWEEPAMGTGSSVDPEGYNVYHKLGDGNFGLLAYVTGNSYAHEEVMTAGWHAYHVTAVYDAGESNPSNEVQLEFLTPPPASLEGFLQDNSAVLNWEEPSAGNSAMAGLLGYNVFHREGADEFEFLEFVQYPAYYHYDLMVGIHAYYVTAVYDGGESLPSNEIELEMVISSVDGPASVPLSIYPNPATDMIRIQSASEMSSVTILNQSGKIMIQEQVGTDHHRISVSQLNTGLYIVGIEDKTGKVIYRRLAVQ